jgi:hypothetical protein
MPLEGLWWSDDMTTFSVGNKSDWKWTLMIMQPEFVTRDLFAISLQQVKKKKNLNALSKLRLEAFIERKAAQILYVGHFRKRVRRSGISTPLSNRRGIRLLENTTRFI